MARDRISKADPARKESVKWAPCPVCKVPVRVMCMTKDHKKFTRSHEERVLAAGLVLTKRHPKKFIVTQLPGRSLLKIECTDCEAKFYAVKYEDNMLEFAMHRLHCKPDAESKEDDDEVRAQVCD